jgi:hypothetical protein
MYRAIALLAFLCSFTITTANAQHHSGSHSSGSHSSKTSKSSKSKSAKDKSVHVRGYTRKDGTYVAPYDRSAPGTADTTSSPTVGATAHTFYREGYVANGYTAHPSVQRDKHGKIKRNKAARSEFERQAPCPSTGKTRGACPGYVVDHISALECGGADAPSNMQWQTIADAKAKDKTERSCH